MKEILCFGDSNTYGLVPGEKRRFSYEERWTGILSEKFKNRFHITEEGLCGRTTVFDDFFREGRKGTQSLPVILESHSDTNLVVLMLGTNDMKTCFKTNEKIISLGIEKLIGQIKDFNPEIKILLVSPILLGEKVWQEKFDPEFDQNSVEVSKLLKAEYEKISKTWNTEFLSACDYAVPSEKDQEHMDKENHRLFAEALAQKIEEIYAA